MFDSRDDNQSIDFDLFLDLHSRDDRNILIFNKTEILKHLKLEDFGQQIVTYHNFPCLIDGGDAIEHDCDDQQRLVRCAARNLLRHITRGTVIEGGNKTPYAKGLALIEKCLTQELNPDLLTALRDEIEAIFKNTANYLSQESKQQPKSRDKQFQIIISQLLSIYPFLNPIDESMITVPQKINADWINVKYQFKQLDISPKTGLLARLIEPEDKIYAYGLQPCADQPDDAHSHLLFMGTTYPTSQGATLAQLYNHRPAYLVGAEHNMADVDTWIKKQTHLIRTTGHDQGAVMAMIAAAKHPTKISHADCLNPTGLNQATLDCLESSWPENPENRPQINVYTQSDNLRFRLGSGFLPGTNIYRVLTNTDQCSNMKWFIPTFFQKAFESTLYLFAARKNILTIKVSTEIENKTKSRVLWSNLEWVAAIVFLPIDYGRLCLQPFVRKATRFYQQNSHFINNLTIASMTIVGILLALTVFFAPLSSFIAAQLCISTTTSLLPVITAGIGAATGLLGSLIVKPVGRLAINIAELVLVDLIPKSILALLLLVTSIATGLKLGAERLFCQSENSAASKDNLSSSARIMKIKKAADSTPSISRDSSYEELKKEFGIGSIVDNGMFSETLTNKNQSLGSTLLLSPKRRQQQLSS